MKYYVTVKPPKSDAFNAGCKARLDINHFLTEFGYKEIIVEPDYIDDPRNVFTKIKKHLAVEKKWEKACSHVQRNDILFIQFPTLTRSIFFAGFINKLSRKGVKTVAIVHDLDTIRFNDAEDRNIKLAIKELIEEKQTLKQFDYIITHNIKMSEVFVKHGFKRSKLIELGIFDYYIEEENINRWAVQDAEDKAVVVAGNLTREKAGYVYKLPTIPKFRLYGANYKPIEQQPNIEYMGKKKPDEIPFQLKGAYGLVWDGPSPDTCEGSWGGYLKINNPHKTSLYLASGLPVIIWKEAALADFIRDNKCGITVSKLNEIDKKMKELSLTEYTEMKANAIKIGKALRRGICIEEAIRKIEGSE